MNICNKVIFSIIFFLFVSNVFAMNPLAKVAVELKQKGYSQQLTLGDMLYSPKADDYSQVTQDSSRIPDDAVKVPSLVNLENQVREFNYTLVHSTRIDEHGILRELWQLSDGSTTWSDENIWIVFAHYWEFKKGIQ